MKALLTFCFSAALVLCGFSSDYVFDLCPKSARPKVASATPAVTTAAAARLDGTMRSTALGAGTTGAAALKVGDSLTFQLFDDVRKKLVLRERTESPLGGETFLASVGESATLTAVVAQDASGVSVNLTDTDAGHVYTVVSSPQGVTVREINPNAGVSEPCRTIVPDLPASVSPKVAALSATADQSSTLIDVLVAYDRNAAAWAKQNGSGITNYATTAVQKMNTAIGNTGFSSKFRFRLVGVMTVDAVGGDDFDGVLDAATDGKGSWASVKETRDQVGADIVTVLIDTGSAYGTTGLGWSLVTTDFASFSEHAYNVCSVRAVDQSHTMTHEVGHNLGAGHSSEQATQPGPQLYSYSSGYYFTASNVAYHTIMAYNDDGRGGSYTGIPYFSSPLYSYRGSAVGDANHDNVQTIASTYAAASQWRAQVVPMSYDVYFSPVSGSLFTDSITVTLTPGKAGLPIRYTVDGSLPTADSTLYTGPFVLTQTTTVRAVTVTDGVAGPVFEATFSLSDLGTGADAPQLVWRTCEDYPWTFQTTETYDGEDALKSGVLPTGPENDSWVETDVTGPTILSFAFRRDYMYKSSFTISCDDKSVFTFDEDGYPNDWRVEEIEIPSGKHTIRFNFHQWGYYGAVFNGIYLDSVRFDALSRPPIIMPETTTDESNAYIFTNSMVVTLIPPVDKAGLLLYTTDGSDPTGDDGKIYEDPITLTQSTHVRAVFVEGGKDPSVEVGGLYLERHPVKPGEWTTDVEGVKAAAAKDGRLICVMRGKYVGCGITKSFYDKVACTEAFLSWAEANGIYLVRADETVDVDAAAAKSWFSSLRENFGDSGTYYFTCMYFALPANPLTAISKGGAGGDYVRIGTVAYSSTIASAVSGFASVLDETVPLAPTTSASRLVSSYPVSVTLSNPNEGGTIYYTLDGSVPTKANGMPYTDAITITKATTLKAAVWPSSGCSSSVLALPFKTIGEVLGTSNVAWSTGGDYPWQEDESLSKTLKTPYVDNVTYTSWLQATVTGKGTLVFTLKGTSYTWQNTVSFSVNGTGKYSYGYDGQTTRSVTLTNVVTTATPTTYRWTYVINDSGRNYNYPNAKCGAWLSDVQWISDTAVSPGGETAYTPAGWSSPIDVDNDWLIAQGLAKEGDSAATVAAKLAETGANGIPRYQSYILGMEPDSEESAEEQLKVTISINSDGEPVVDYQPTPREPSHVTVRKLGRTSLPKSGDTGWDPIADDMDGYKFFKIEVEVK